MEPIRVQVQCYSGHQPSPKGYGLAGKADERPLRFLVEGDEIEIEEVFDQWLAASKKSGQQPSDYFKVRGSDGHEYLLRHERETDVWQVVNRW